MSRSYANCPFKHIQVILAPFRKYITTALKPASLAAFLLFLSINACLALAGALNSAQNQYADQKGVFETIDSAIQQFKKEKTRPNIVMLGSSLIMSPVWASDFVTFPGVGDFYRHHHSILLAKLLSKPDQDPWSVFSFAVPGGMVSDMYLIVDKLLAGARAPDLIIYGIAPRDFMDDLAGAETKTAVFQRLGTVSDLGRSQFATSTQDEKLELLLNRSIYLFSKRNRYQARVEVFARKLMFGGDKPSALKPEVAICPLLEDHDVLWRRSLEEYRMRYHRFSQTQFKKHEGFLRDLLSECREKQIEIVLVNMPLTKANLNLMPDGVYDRYKKELTDITNEYSVPFIDLSLQKYADMYFYDTVHLNRLGGQEFLQTLSQWITAHSTTAERIAAAKNVTVQ